MKSKFGERLRAYRFYACCAVALATLVTACSESSPAKAQEHREKTWGEPVWGLGGHLTIDEFRALRGPTPAGQAWRVPARNGVIYAIPKHLSLEPGERNTGSWIAYSISFQLTESPPAPVEGPTVLRTAAVFDAGFTATTDVFEGSAHSWPVPANAETRLITLADGRSFTAVGTGWDCDFTPDEIPKAPVFEGTPRFWIEGDGFRIYAACTRLPEQVSPKIPRMSCKGMWRARDWDGGWFASNQPASPSCNALVRRWLGLVIDVPIVLNSWAENSTEIPK